ncbi:MAG: hypothetical protein ABIJ04_04805 [Bacteroidota bacterium]
MITTQEGLSKWWLADCTVRPELGFINEFRYHGYVSNKMKIIDLQPNCESGIGQLDQKVESEEIRRVKR